jgi:hypothetical protein
MQAMVAAAKALAATAWDVLSDDGLRQAAREAFSR